MLNNLRPAHLWHLSMSWWLQCLSLDHSTRLLASIRMYLSHNLSMILNKNLNPSHFIIHSSNASQCLSEKRCVSLLTRSRDGRKQGLQMETSWRAQLWLKLKNRVWRQTSFLLCSPSLRAVTLWEAHLCLLHWLRLLVQFTRWWEVLLSYSLLLDPSFSWKEDFTDTIGWE